MYFREYNVKDKLKQFMDFFMIKRVKKKGGK